MKRASLIKKWLCGALTLCMLTGCAGGTAPESGSAPETSGTGNAKTAMGRYVEEELPLPEEGTKGISLRLTKDGALDYFCADKDEMTGATSNLRHYRYSGGAWQKQDTPWMEQIKQNPNGLIRVTNIEEGPDGSLYVIINDVKERLRLFHVQNNQAQEIDVEYWNRPFKQNENLGTDGSEQNTPQTNGDALRVVKLIPMQDGSLFMGYSRGSEYCIVHGADGKTIKVFPAESDYGYSEFSADGSRVYGIDYNGKISVFQMDGTPAGSIDASGFADAYTGLMTADANGDLYFCNVDGISRMAQGGSVWETLLDGTQSVLSIPAYTATDFILDGGEGFYYSLNGMVGSDYAMEKIIHCTWRDDVPSLPDTTLTVYSLHDTPTIRQAIGSFRRSHPEAMVDYRVGMPENSSATQNDVIRALNTELLAGKGPDVLVLDGLPGESYVEKGVLSDITEVIPAGKLLPGLEKAWQKDGKTYAIPARFTIPVIGGSVKDTSGLNSLADWAKDWPGEPQLFAADTPDKLIQELAASSSPAWQKEDGSLDEAKLTDFLTAARTLYEKYNNNDEAQSWGTSVSSSGQNNSTAITVNYNELKYTVGDSRVCIAQPMNYSALRGMMTTVMVDAGGNRSIEAKFARHMTGQVDGAYLPINSLGVCSGSKQQELAKAFVAEALSADVQNYTFNDGFPVAKAPFEKGMKEMLNEIVRRGDKDGVFTEDNSAFENSGDTMALFTNLKTPVKTDPVLVQAVTELGEGCVKGEKTVEQAVKEITEQVRLRLAEQG